MVLWDNRSVMHKANGDYDMNEVRHLHRILIKGETVPAAENAVTRAHCAPARAASARMLQYVAGRISESN